MQMHSRLPGLLFQPRLVRSNLCRAPEICANTIEVPIALLVSRRLHHVHVDNRFIGRVWGFIVGCLCETLPDKRECVVMRFSRFI